MLIKFTKDFARNWQAGEIVEAKYLGKGEMLVGNVAKVDSNLLFKYCKIISEPDCDKTGLTSKELEYCKNDCIALNILEVPENLHRKENKTMPRFELGDLAHLLVLINQCHPEVEALELHMDEGNNFVYIRYNKDFVTKLSFNINDDPLNLYRRILDDILDTAFVSNNANMI